MKNGRILYVGEGVTSTGFASATPSESGNPPGYGLSVSHSTERGHRADRERSYKKVTKQKQKITVDIWDKVW